MAIEWSWKLNTRLILLCVDCVWYAAILMITSGYTVWVNAYASTTGIAGILLYAHPLRSVVMLTLTL